MHNDSARLYIDDQLLIDKWSNTGTTWINTIANFTAEAGKVYRLRVDYASRTSNEYYLDLLFKVMGFLPIIETEE